MSEGRSIPKKGKGSAVLIRVTRETRDMLDAEALRTGRSLSAVAESMLERAILFDRLVAARLLTAPEPEQLKAAPVVQLITRD